MTQVTRRDSLDGLFEQSIPATPCLTLEQARIASGMHRAGRDATAIALRVGAPPSAVAAYLRTQATAVAGAW